MITPDTYIKRDYPSCFYPPAFASGHQFFLRPFVMSPSDDQLVSLVDAGIVDLKRDIPFMESLLDLRFVTIDMLRSLYPDMPAAELTDRMERLVSARVLNKFAVNLHRREYGDAYPADGLDYYCLDAGGKRILCMYGNPLCIPDRWSVGNVSMGIVRLSMHLAMTELFISLKKACRQNLSYFETNKALKYSGGIARFAGEFAVRYKDGDRHYLCSVASSDRIVPDFRDELDNTIAFMTSKACKAHFADNPDTPVVMLVITETEEDALYIAGMVERKIAAAETEAAFRYITETDIKNGLAGERAFLRYEPPAPDSNGPGSMQRVRVSVFSDTDWGSAAIAPAR